MGNANMDLKFLALLIFIYHHVWTNEGVDLLGYLRNIEQPATVYYNGTIVQYQNYNFQPRNAIDGETGDPDSCNCCAALHRPSSIWINLGACYNFSRIVVYGRQGQHSDQFENIQLTVQNGSYEETFLIATTNGIYVLQASKSLNYVQTITLYSKNLGIMTICEVMIFQAEVNKTSQSSTYENCQASNAINNMLFTQAGKDDVTLCKACSVTINETNPWWELDLGFLTLLRQINTFGRTDGGTSEDQSRNIELRISNTTLRSLRTGTQANSSTSSNLTAYFDAPRLARYINIKHISAEYNFLTICEVSVFAGECPIEKYGDFCSRTCHCKDRCDVATGQCSKCLPGWTSTRCDEACHGFYGDNCTTVCSWNCRDNETCNHVDGHCTHGCQPGYSYADQTCTTACDPGYFGDNCSSQCHCENGEVCHHVFGNCSNNRCAAGWKGDNCSNECEQGLYGINCSSECHCQDGVNCDHVLGNCSDKLCAPGWLSDDCSRECEHDSYGMNCTATCHCQHGVKCDHVHGNCSDHQCAAGWTSYNCSQECEDGFYGINCITECHCQHADLCDHVHGNCTDKKCAAGWIMENCSKACEKGHFSMDCSSPCHCREDSECDHVAGNCSDGQCSPGWTGHNCSTTCEKGHFGMDCSSPCHCREDAECDHVAGNCSDGRCSPGWTGHNCSTTCEKGHFGMDCSSPCHCREDAECDHVAGNCSGNRCSPGWTGHNCSTTCDYGNFGVKCASDCHCQKHAVCDHISGNCSDFECSPGWTGHNCSIAHTFPTVSDKDSKGVPISAFVAVVVFLAIAVGCNIVLATYYIKQRRKRQSGTENNTIVKSSTSLRSDEYDTISPRLQETNDYEGLQMETRTYYNY